MKTFTYNKANLVKVSDEQVKINLDILQAIVCAACECIHSGSSFSHDSYNQDKFHISWKTELTVGKPMGFDLDFKVKYCETNNTYWVDFYISDVLIRTKQSYRKYKTNGDNSMSVGLATDEMKVRNLKKVLEEFINNYYPNIFDVL